MTADIGRSCDQLGSLRSDTRQSHTSLGFRIDKVTWRKLFLVRGVKEGN